MRAALPPPLKPKGKGSGKGGKREGAGRPKGSVVEKRYKTVADALQREEMEGLTPIVVMLDNMKFYTDRAHAFTEQLQELAEGMTIEEIKSGGDRVINLLKMIEKTANFRGLAQQCAVDAAPYAHPRLAAMAIKVGTGDSKKPNAEITQQMTPKIAAEIYAAYLAGEDEE